MSVAPVAERDMTFAGLGVPADVVAHLSGKGIDAAFPIQAGTIPAALEGRDVSGRAPTGSGKTFAFGIPLAHRVSRARPARPRALILVPTRELAAQIEGELSPLLKLRGRSVATFYGGVSFTPQLKMLRRGVDVAVACPGRLADLVRRGNMILDEVEIVVLDEADRMADMGFLPEVRRILDQVRPNRQTLLFSATLDGDVDVLIRHYQRDPLRCEVAAPADEIDLTTHRFLTTRRDLRVDLTAELVERHGPTVVFCRTKHGADRLATQLSRTGVAAVAIHGDRTQAQRDRALAAFMAGRAEALVATDVAARGIHVDDVGCVVHFDLPQDHKDYVHRSGRTGRAGNTGMVVAFVTEADRAKARNLLKALPQISIERLTADAPAPRHGRTAKTVMETPAPSSAPPRKPGSAGQARKPGRPPFKAGNAGKVGQAAKQGRPWHGPAAGKPGKPKSRSGKPRPPRAR